MSTENAVNQLKQMAAAAAAGEAATDKPLTMSEAKERFMSLDRASRDMVGFAALIKLLLNNRDKLNDEQQVDLVENGIMFYRGSVLLHTFEVILPVLIKIVDGIQKAKKSDEFLPHELDMIHFAQDIAVLALQVDDDHEKDRLRVNNLMEILKPEGFDEQNKDTEEKK